MSSIIKEVLIITLIAISVINDLYNYRVRNEITFSFAIIGIIYNLVFWDLQQLYGALLGIFIPLVLLFPLYAAKMFGAGDIKLFSALGAFLGLKLVLVNIAYSFMTGAIIAVLIMLIRKNALQRIKYFFTYLRCCYMCMSIIPYCEINEKNDGTKMHFTIPIGLGTILVLIQ